MIGLIWAEANNHAIGANGTMPWNIPEDMAFFREVTNRHVVAMGKNTWYSLTPQFRPLPNRFNIVVTSDREFQEEGAHVLSSWNEVKNVLKKWPFEPLLPSFDNNLLWVVGGAQLYASAIEDADIICVTEFDFDVPNADAFAPKVPASLEKISQIPSKGWHYSRHNGIPLRITLYARPEYRQSPLLPDIEQLFKTPVLSPA